MENPQKIARIFKVLSVDTRVRILQILKEKVLCVSALASRLEVSSAAVSQHLRILRDADLVVSEKRGYYVHYKVNDETLEEWRRIAEDLLTPEE